MFSLLSIKNVNMVEKVKQLQIKLQLMCIYVFPKSVLIRDEGEICLFLAAVLKDARVLWDRSLPFSALHTLLTIYGSSHSQCSGFRASAAGEVRAAPEKHISTD